MPIALLNIATYSIIKLMIGSLRRTFCFVQYSEKFYRILAFNGRQQSNARDQINKSHKMYELCTQVCVFIVVVVVVADICCYFSCLKWLFSLLSHFLFTFWTENIRPWIFNASKDYVCIMCKMLFIYSFIVNICEPTNERLYAYSCLHSCDRMQCICHACVGVHIFVCYKLEHKYRMQNVSLLVNLYIFVCRKSQRIHKHQRKHTHRTCARFRSMCK